VVVKQHAITSKNTQIVLNGHCKLAQISYNKVNNNIKNVHLNIFAYERISPLAHLCSFCCSPQPVIDDFHSFLPISIWSFSDSVTDAISKKANLLNRIFSFESLKTFHWRWATRSLRPKKFATKQVLFNFYCILFSVRCMI